MKNRAEQNPDTGWFYPHALMGEQRAARADVISEMITGGHDSGAAESDAG